MTLKTITTHPSPSTCRTLRVVVAAVTVAALLALPTAVSAQSGPFSDVPDDAYYSVAVSSLAAQGVFAGTECGDGFCPDDPLDRKTMAVWIVRVLDGAEPVAVSETRFDDVDADGFHAPFVERMAELGVTTGCGDGTGFCPNATVTRAQMAVFLSRAYNLPAAADPSFADVPADAWYRSDVAKLAASGITRGCGDGTVFCPGDDTTRAQMATFLHRAENRPEPEEEVNGAAEILPLRRCTTGYGAGLVPVLVGIEGDTGHRAVAAGPGAACDVITAYWAELMTAEAGRPAPCEYPWMPGDSEPTPTGYPVFGDGTPADIVALWVGCWPRVALLEDHPPDIDPDAYLLPRNTAAVRSALHDCYRDALEGPPVGHDPDFSPTVGFWPRVSKCNETLILSNLGWGHRVSRAPDDCVAREYRRMWAAIKAEGWESDWEVDNEGWWEFCDEA